MIPELVITISGIRSSGRPPTAPTGTICACWPSLAANLGDGPLRAWKPPRPVELFSGGIGLAGPVLPTFNAPTVRLVGKH